MRFSLSFVLQSLAVISLFTGSLIDVRRANAADWRLSKQITTSLSSIQGSSDEDTGGSSRATVSTVEPQLVLIGSGNSSDVLVLAELQYIRSNAYNEGVVNPRILGAINSEVVQDIFNVNSELELGRVALGPTGTNLGLINPGNEFYNTYDLSVNPSLKFPLSSSVGMEANYNFFSYATGADQIPDSQTNSVSLQLKYLPPQTSLEFGVISSIERTEFSFGRPLIQRELGGSIASQLGTDWRLSGALGKDWYQIPFASAADITTEEDPEFERSTYWDIALSWSPDNRSSVILGYGEKQNGKRPHVEFRHRLRRSEYTLSWSRVLSISDKRLSSFSSIQPSDDEISGNSEDFITNSLDDDVMVFFDNRASILEQIQAGYSIRGRRSTINIDVLHTQREFGTDAGSATERRLALKSVFERRLSRSASIALSYEYLNRVSLDRYIESRVGLAFTYILR